MGILDRLVARRGTRSHHVESRDRHKRRGVPGNFVLRVNAVQDWDGNTMVSCHLLSGGKPKGADRFRISRSGKTGTMADAMSLGDTFDAARQAGASVTVLGTGSSLQSSVAFRTCDVPARDFIQGDELTAC